MIVLLYGLQSNWNRELLCTTVAHTRCTRETRALARTTSDVVDSCVLSVYDDAKRASEESRHASEIRDATTTTIDAAARV